MPIASVGNAPALATAAANSGESVIQDMPPWMIGNLVPHVLATGLSIYFASKSSLRCSNCCTSPEKTLTAWTKSAPNLLTKAAAKVASTPSGISSSRFQPALFGEIKWQRR